MNKMPLGLRFIALAKIAKGVALSGVSLGLFDLVGRDLNELALKFIVFARISPENHYARILMEKAGVVDAGELRKAGIAASIYASILLLEGLGLWFGAWWAEYVVVITTGLFVPEELWATILRFSWGKAAVLVVNGVILAYVVRIVWLRHLERRRISRGNEQAAP